MVGMRCGTLVAVFAVMLSCLFIDTTTSFVEKNTTFEESPQSSSLYEELEPAENETGGKEEEEIPGGKNQRTGEDEPQIDNTEQGRKDEFGAPTSRHGEKGTERKDVESTVDEAQGDIESKEGTPNNALRRGWFMRFLGRLKGMKNKECRRIKENGGVPTSHSAPLKVFGYPYFDEHTKKHSVRAALPLSKINGFLIPIKVGSRDYVVQGNPERVLVFTECFSAYMVVGSFLREDGHWDSTPHTDNPLFLQVTNVGAEPFESVKTHIVHHSVETLLRRIGPLDTLGQSVAEGLRNIKHIGPAMKTALTKVAGQWMWLENLMELASVLHMSLEDAAKAWDAISREDTFPKKVRKFLSFLTKAHNRISNQWSGAKNIDLTRKITLTITMYPRQENGVRATRKLSNSTVSVEELFEALKELVTDRGLADILHL